MTTVAARPEVSPILDQRGHESRSRWARSARRTVAALLVWCAIVVAGRAWALALDEEGARIVLFTPPVLGGYRPSLPATVWLPATIGLVLAWALPRVVERLRWSTTCLVSSAAALVWWVALALVDGVTGLTRGLQWAADYDPTVPAAAADPIRFLGGYVPDLAGQPIALRGHPPGFVLLFAALERIGLGGRGWAAAVVLIAAASAIVALLVTLRLVAGEARARRAAPFLVLAPAALWIATSTDALTMASAAWVVAAMAAAGRHDGRSADLLAAVAGLLAAFTAMQSYGLVLMVLPVSVVAVAQRRVRPILVASGVALGSTAAFSVAGFWWFDGLSATVHEYRALGLDRPYVPFLVINLAAWALALGPVTAVGLARLRDRGAWVVVGGGLLAVAAAEISGLSSGEVERIWLPFTLLVLPAGLAVWSSRAAATFWLSVQVATALALTATIRTPW
jgi:hypothetical protein